MAEKLNLIDDLSREDQYRNLLPQLKALIDGDDDLISSTANVTAALKEAFGFLWVGFYFVKGNQLVLGPFQGKIACSRIAKGKGVCGSAWAENKTMLVPDVDKFKGHIACDSSSRSEIVIPLRGKDDVQAVLDIDSDQLNDFTGIDSFYLGEVVKIIEQKFYA